MRIVVLGASGGCGRQLVTQGVAAGHSVVAVGRATSELPEADGVDVVRGDLADPVFLASAFEGADAVLLAVGFRLAGLGVWNRPKDPDFLRQCAGATVEAARTSGVRRLMAISAGGAGDSYVQMPWIFRTFIQTTSMRHVYPELGKMEAVFLESGLDVCLPRPSGLTDGPVTGRVTRATSYAGRATISRADVAAWMLEQLQEASFPYQSPLITETGAAGAES